MGAIKKNNSINNDKILFNQIKENSIQKSNCQGTNQVDLKKLIQNKVSNINKKSINKIKKTLQDYQQIISSDLINIFEIEKSFENLKSSNIKEKCVQLEKNINEILEKYKNDSDEIVIKILAFLLWTLVKDGNYKERVDGALANDWVGIINNNKHQEFNYLMIKLKELKEKIKLLYSENGK